MRKPVSCAPYGSSITFFSGCHRLSGASLLPVPAKYTRSERLRIPENSQGGFAPRFFPQDFPPPLPIGYTSNTEGVRPGDESPSRCGSGAGRAAPARHRPGAPLDRLVRSPPSDPRRANRLASGVPFRGGRPRTFRNAPPGHRAGPGALPGPLLRGRPSPGFELHGSALPSATSRRWGSRRTSRRGSSPSFSDAFTTYGPGRSTNPPRSTWSGRGSAGSASPR